ncbi:MAG: Zn-ribbon domain-containing OB-fold protein [Blastocatellia bacterium]|nr:Zn-ribbon domain-containing OB-fold protein [Blastocatellia bacterium]MCS7156120.1 Zn-ribbon domain-containing OB-fold protein [Blastocatellia bacterium]MDW8169243.1 Zn-ribbon domain-containing OB-fold protein [Acidobacteriota bacterium]MDW8256102.1 Zn-ribbon domain-containing OB-fold protein [Acidobacteriota bacterium]
MSEWVVHQRIRIPFEYTAGRTISRFLMGLAERRIWATRCGECGRVYVPPLGFCGRCWREIAEWRELPDEGELVSYTVRPIEPPVILGLIRLDGADTHLVHRLGEVEPTELEQVVRVRAVWRQERTGSILDIVYFAPVR